MPEIPHTTHAHFEADVLKAGKPVLVDFYATWCGPCKMVAKHLDEIAAERGASLNIFKLDIDAHPQAAQQWGVMSLPTLVLFKGGQPVARVSGYKTKAMLDKEFGPHLS